ncbi:hypothetical protein M406DRAFT_50127 [Cryphonectria parasitica EP155]|uniref:Meiotically up-regulated gene 190 protein n=1 Tax=Cryphonectria parasitica (strain ATCC 38755 / EP155) TaxID=660469 RepID=A0A9P4XUZ1_CRYP1|nr:uncharacterized protein M406DRAFT_50127 [Cryphonectria parasitica EP155]KAF3761767.1 hypothetical protein M406DRAFT_50127 [Cryphonectria parasitica EP155]
MSSTNQENFDDEAASRSHTKPRSGGHPIPTIQGYREHRRQLQDQLQETEEAQEGPEDESRPRRAYDSDKEEEQQQNAQYERDTQQKQDAQQQQQQGDDKDGQQAEKSATEHVASTTDPKAKRKAMKKASRNTGGREVTDPVTHLPLVIHDQTDKDLNSAPENEPEPGEHHTTATGPQGASKPDEQLREEQEMAQRGFNGIQRLFPPPEFGNLKKELAGAYEKAVTAGLTVIAVAAAGPFLLASLSGQDRWIPSISTIISILFLVAVTLGTAWGMGQWLSKRVADIVDDETWETSRREEEAILDSDTELPESVQWFNSLLASIWPLVNPDLFSSLIDEIEDIMQASLPKVVKMVSIDDMGQGNQSLRILGVRWLPSGAASQSVGPGGKLERSEKKGQSDRTDPESGQAEIAIREGMEAEEGDFVNLEMALAYRSRTSGKNIKEKSKNAHLYLKFYSVGGVALPVWVEVRGFIATLRLRLQLTPDPPFVSLCTLTFLGQPKASMACVPLSKHAPNLMDVPMISSFVQSAIDAALAEYVAPKSLTLNLKDMLMGEDFKKDTGSRGVVLVFIKSAHGFKQGDGGVGPAQGSSDAYCTVSWGKFGKTVASTRIIPESQDPEWHEYAAILVTAEELNAGERLRLQLWDSDKWTADDDLGRVEVDLKELMHNPETHNKMVDREDRFTGQDPDEKIPGSLQWSVGYFAKVRITEQQLQKQTVDENIRTRDQLRQHVSELAANKLREAGKRSDDDDELHQQRVQDYGEIEDNMIISAPPSQEHVSGILSVQIHNITGLEIQNLQKQDKGNDDDTDGDGETETGDDMPDSYCNIILNHKKIYRTRTKPKNSKPFFNAGTERFVRDWRTTDIFIAVRDARERENDPLIGMIYLPLQKVFAEKSQVVDVYPLVGGVGYGRARISMVWRSVELKLPRNLLGWDYGTLEIRGAIRAKSGGLPDKLLGNRIKIRTDLGKTKVYSNSDSTWSLGKRENREGESAFLPVRKRYASALVLEFRESVLGPDKSPAFAVLWLQELVDEESEVRTLKVWKGGKDRLGRAQKNYDYRGLDEGEQPLGEVELELKFWRGLSGYHKHFASRSKTGNMRDVMECLDTITDENLTKDDDDKDGVVTDEEDSGDKEAKKKLKVHTNDDSSSDDSSFGSDDEQQDSSKPHSTLGLGNSLRDYKDHHKQLHRKHRGIMQWRVAREADHLGGKLSNLKDNVSGLFHHGDKEAGVETEI